MALQKTFVLPGWGHTSNYVRIDSIERVDHLQRTAKVNLRLYADSATAKLTDVAPQSHPFGVLILSREAFDTYLGKAALKRGTAVGLDVHAMLYQCLKDVAAASAAKLASPSTIRPDQTTLLEQAQFSGMFPEKAQPLAGMTDA